MTRYNEISPDSVWWDPKVILYDFVLKLTYPLKIFDHLCTNRPGCPWNIAVWLTIRPGAGCKAKGSSGASRKPSEAMFSTSTGKLTLKTSCFRTGLKIVILYFCCVLEFEGKVALRLFPKTLKNINLQRLFPRRCGLEEHSFTLATSTTSILSHYIGSLILIPITVLQH